MSQGLSSVHCNEAEGGPSHPRRGRARVGWREGGEIEWEPRDWINSVDPGDWEINHVLKRLSFKKTGSFLVRFPFSFGERRGGGLHVGDAGGGHELKLFHT